jgi:hypothetical protein
MNYTINPYPYVRGLPPASPESKEKYYQEELKKLEKVLAVVYQCLLDVKAKVP